MKPASGGQSGFDQSGQSLSHMWELVSACLDAREAASVVEIGGRAGELTRELAARAVVRGGTVAAIEPSPELELEELAARRPELELIPETSLDALRWIEVPDALIVDGDHNYYTVSEELRIAADRSRGTGLPLLLLHDVGWPHARRDTYYAPERIPERYRQPMVENAALAPGEPAVSHAGLRYRWAAAREGGPRNGVLTAVEDFVAERDRLRLAVVPAFFGLAVLWEADAPWADTVLAAVMPWDRNPLLARLEKHRVANVVERSRQAQELEEIAAMRSERARHAEQERLLRAMLGSRAFAWGESLSRLRKGGRPVFSREQVRRALGEPTD
jgi:hypothetical protein